MIELVYVSSISIIIFLITIGVLLAWDIGLNWGRRDAEEKWKKKRNL